MIMRSRLWTGLIVGVACAGFLILTFNSGIFAQAQLRMSNIFYIATPTSENIVIVALDDASLSAYGRSPAMWRRSLYAELIERLSEANARVIAFDLIFSETDPEDEIIVQAMATARTSGARTRFVLATAGAGTPITRSSLPDYPAGIRIVDALRPNANLIRMTDYAGFVDTFADVDNHIRRQTAIIDYNDELHVSFNIATYLAYLRIPASTLEQVITADGDYLQITPQRRIKVNSFGLWMNNFFGEPSTNMQSTFPVISFRDVIEGYIDEAVFNDKIVFVGLMNSAGSTDRYLVPISSNDLMAGVEIHANAVETLIQDKALRPQSPGPVMFMIAVASIFISTVTAHPRWYWKGAIWAICMMLATIITSLIFSSLQIVVNLFYLWLALSLPVLIAVGAEASQEINRRLYSEFLLESVTKVEQQRLLVDRIWPLIAVDVRRIIPDANGMIFKPDSNTLQPVQTVGKDHDHHHLQTLARRALESTQPKWDKTGYALPIVWQDMVYGVITLAGYSPRSSGRHILEDLTRRIAPGLANASLYEEVRRKNDLQTTIFDNIPEAVIVLNNTLHAVQWNASLERLASPNLVNVDFPVALQNMGIADHIIAELESAFKRGVLFKREMSINTRTVNMTAAPLDDGWQWVVIFADVTQLAELSQLKTRMIRMASHDLKNPLSRVMGYASLIESEPSLPDAAQKFTHYISQSADEMLHIINDILDLEQLRSGDMPKETLDFATLIRGVSARHEPDFARKTQMFETTCPDVAVLIKGNHRQLSQSVSNLLSNATKYTPEGGKVSLRLNVTDNIARLEIQDNGFGISEEAQTKLFREFYRVRTQNTAQISGTGLGLSLVKSVVESHNGRVWVHSQEGVGSTFFIELPVLEQS